jgi:hypothetical protein
LKDDDVVAEKTEHAGMSETAQWADYLAPQGIRSIISAKHGISGA